MHLIVGLGNPGEKYKNTRHNIGFTALDTLCNCDWEKEKYSNSLICKTDINDKPVILCKPQTFMNSSGEAVKTLADQKKIDIENIIVFQDEMELPLGEIKIVKDRSAKGHNGIRSIINSLNTKNFTRVCIGIGKPTENAESFVLENFSNSDQSVMQSAINQSIEELKQII